MDKPVSDSAPSSAPASPAAQRRGPKSRPEDKPAETRSNVRAAGLAMLIALALMGVFNSSGLRSFVRDLPDGALTDALVQGADRWHELMLAAGPAHVRPVLRDLFDGLREVRFTEPANSASAR